MIRQHQFDKVEMVSIVAPEASEAEHERMTACAEGVLDALGLRRAFQAASAPSQGVELRDDRGALVLAMDFLRYRSCSFNLGVKE